MENQKENKASGHIEKNKIAAYLLNVFLGIFGAHRFYMKKPVSATIQLMLSLTLWGIVASGIWSIVDLFFTHKWVDEYNKSPEKYTAKQITFKDLFHISSLKVDNQKLRAKIDQDSGILSKKLTLQQMKPVELEKLIGERQAELDEVAAAKNKIIEEKRAELLDAKNKIKKEISTLKTERQELLSNLDQLNLEQSIEETIKAKRETLDEVIDKLTSSQSEIDKLSSEKTELQQEIASLSNKYNLDDVKDLNSVIEELRFKKEELQEEVASYEDQAAIESYGLYTPHYSFTSSAQYKNKLRDIRDKQKQLIRDGLAGSIFRPMLLDGSASKGRSMQKKNIKQLVRSFNVECEAAINKVSVANIERIEKRIVRSFDQLNKLNEPNGVCLSAEYLALKKDELHLAFEYEQQKEKEKELLREEREKEREERLAQREIAKKKKQLEKDKKHYKKAHSEVLQKIQSTPEESDKIASLKEELTKLEAKLTELNSHKQSLDYREAHATAGYVYIISNIGSFGRNVFKIGVTRRLEPLDRIRELSSASVPFKFDVHALIFSDDAYKLEAHLHKYFDNNRINKVNNRKEFFAITIDEVKEALDKYYNRTFDFKEIPDAQEYRDSLKIENRTHQTV